MGSAKDKHGVRESSRKIREGEKLFAKNGRSRTKEF